MMETEDREVRPRGSGRRRALAWSLVIVVVVVVAGGVGLAVRGDGGTAADGKKGNKKKEAVPAAPVELATARLGRMATFAQNTTTLEARHSAVLVARRAGQVVAVPAEEGQWVNRGDVLARLDDREARLKVERTELAAQVAQRELERGRQLRDSGYLSPKELDDLEVKKRDAWVDLEQARYELSQMAITAPFSGRVVERMVQLGETVTEGRECFRIADFHPILARVYFPERELTHIHVGQPATLTLDVHPGDEFHGRVSLVNPVVDRANGTFKVTLEFPNPSGKLRPGTFAQARIQTGEFDHAVLVPRRGLLTEDGESYVFMARGDSVVRAQVAVGAIEGDTAQILEGIGAGDRIVTVGQGGLKPGAKIKAVTL